MLFRNLSFTPRHVRQQRAMGQKHSLSSGQPGQWWGEHGCLQRPFPKVTNNQPSTCFPATSLKHRTSWHLVALSQTRRTPGTVPLLSKGSPRLEDYDTDSNVSQACAGGRLSFPAMRAGKTHGNTESSSQKSFTKVFNLQSWPPVIFFNLLSWFLVCYIVSYLPI